MNILSYKHIEFVPNKVVTSPNKDDKTIFVFSKRSNGKIHKRKKFELGVIFKHPKVKEWCFYPIPKMTFLPDTMMIISTLLGKLNDRLIKYNPKKGEFSKL